MMKSILRVLLYVWTALLIVPSFAAPVSSSKTQAKPWLEKESESTSASAKKILFIGNSKFFYNSMPKMFAYMAKEKTASLPLKIFSVYGDAFSLRQHWETGLARQIIRANGPWDYVVLLESSGFPEANPRQYAETLLLFDAEIKKAGARTVIVENYVDKPQNYQRCHDTMSMLAKRYGAYLLPIGTAWNVSRMNNSGIDLFDPDKHHPSTKGTYLMSCVCFAYFIGRDPRTLPDNFYRLNDAGETAAIFEDGECRKLQESAWTAVSSMRR
ncbi:MAG: hypothetical protein K2Z81_22605 [Cyanobacteria bacterium]|nr:hypothetical protein [Cyanobacteriota bacterium]